MNLINTIKNDLKIARYAKDTKSITILSTLLGSAAMIGKTKRNSDSTDEEVVSVVKQFLEGINENINMYSFIDENSDKVLKFKFERDLIMKYFPVQLTEEELKGAINEIISNYGMTTIGQVGLVMSDLKKHYNGKYDGAIAIQFVRESLI